VIFTMDFRYNLLVIKTLIVGLTIVINLSILLHSTMMVLPDFTHYKTPQSRHNAFQHFLLPKIETINNKVKKGRQRLILLHQQFVTGGPLRQQDLSWLNSQFLQVKEIQIYHVSFWQTLLEHVDIVPARLVLNQIKKDNILASSPKTYNIFQIPCLGRACNPPLKRYADNIQLMNIIRIQLPAKQRKELKLTRYHSMQTAIAGYLFLLNSSPAFKTFRQWRHQQRINHLAIDHWQRLSAAQPTIIPSRLLTTAAYS
jgi:uncharacterized FlgJ-related protein